MLRTTWSRSVPLPRTPGSGMPVSVPPLPPVPLLRAPLTRVPGPRLGTRDDEESGTGHEDGGGLANPRRTRLPGSSH